MWLELLRRFWPYLLAGAASFGVAWQVQGIRLTWAEQEFVQYKADQREASLRAAAVAQKQRETADHDYQALSAKLKDQIARNQVWERCVAAGKCGRMQPRPACPANSLPAPGVPDDPGRDELPAPGGGPTEAGEAPQLVNDCAVVTLRLNELQRLVEDQPGY